MLKIAAVVLSVCGTAMAQDWKPVEGRIMTRWAKEVDPKNPWPEYPRPTMVREKWQNLNGLWDYGIFGLDPSNSDKWQGKILVPFPVESALSGVGKRITDKQTLHYRRTFTVPADWRTEGQRVLLHFGAVDWAAVVHVNGKQVGEHKGGYAPFSFDITDALKSGGENEITVAVLDPTDAGGQPRGKQWAEPRGIWYTPTSGIWQTVWMEPTPALSVGELHAGGTSDGVAKFLVKPKGDSAGAAYEVAVLEGGKALASMKVDGAGEHELTMKLGGVVPWTPDNPKLYDVEVTASKGGKVVDRVKSYIAFRDVKMAKDADGIHRLMLNGKPTFMYGPLDQGFWPDGLYTPPNEAAMVFDLEAAKKMGCNMLRKHVKVESERYYAACDRMGLMVWQDIPSPFPPAEKEDGHFRTNLPAEWKENFAREAREIMTDFGRHPSIVLWVPFNEGWGQVDTAWAKGMVDEVKKWDPSRLVDCASGWTDTGNGDMFDAHIYPGPGMGPLQANRATVLGEFGGLGLPVPGHTWVNDKANWGYVNYKNREELTDAYVGLMRQLPVLIGEGLCAAVYTQTTDVEIECNGWLTYDREVWKIDPAKASAAMKGVYGPPPKVTVVVPRAGQAGGDAEWWYTEKKPEGDAWMKTRWAADPDGWKRGKGGFGSPGTPGAVIGTEWRATPGDLWIRRGVELKSAPTNPMLSIHHDEDAEVYINGELAASLKGYTSSYALVPVSEKAAAILKKEKSIIIAVHCHQTNGGQYIDVGISDLVQPK